jgi:hypothetical protein
VALALPLSVAWLPMTSDAFPEAVAPKPPALAFWPLAEGVAPLAVLSETKAPAAPATILPTAWSVA